MLRRMATPSPIERFRALHEAGTFVMPNPWDVGSARVLATMGFPALATTSSGHAASLGRLDQRVTRDELVAHAAQLAAAVDVPLNVDAECCFPWEPGGVARTVELIGSAGAAGCSIEDYDPRRGSILELGEAVDRVREAVMAAKAAGLVLTARAEGLLYGVGDVDAAIERLQAFSRAGADVLYAPGLLTAADIGRVVRAVERPVNVLALPGCPPVGDLAALGVRRVSTGGSLAWVASGALARAGRELLQAGPADYRATTLTRRERQDAFGA